MQCTHKATFVTVLIGLRSSHKSNVFFKYFFWIKKVILDCLNGNSLTPQYSYKLA